MPLTALYVFVANTLYAFVNRMDNAVANKSVNYEYDFVGNIIVAKTYAYTTGALGMSLTTNNYT